MTTYYVDSSAIVKRYVTEDQRMDEPVVVVRLPASLYAELESLAAEEQTDPVGMIGRLVTMASQRSDWLRDLTALREEIRQAGGLKVGTTKDEVVERLRQTRREIFEAEYAHLYGCRYVT